MDNNETVSLPDSLIGLRDEIEQSKFDEFIAFYGNLSQKHKISSDCEQNLQVKHRDDEKRLLEGKINIEKLIIQQQENREKFKSLQGIFNETQLASAKEERTVSVLQYELQRVEETNIDLQTQVNDLLEKNKQLVQTELQKLKSIIYSLKDDISKATKKEEKETSSLREIESYIADLMKEQDEKIKIRNERKQSINEMETSEDIKLRIEEVKKEVGRLSSNADNITSQLDSCESSISMNSEKLKKVQGSKKHLGEHLQREQVNAKKRCNKYEEIKVRISM